MFFGWVPVAGFQFMVKKLLEARSRLELFRNKAGEVSRPAQLSLSS
jgi:hypothetical protein